MTNRVAVVLAAGEGKRMQSSLPKVLHSVCGKTLLGHVVSAVKAVCSQIIVVIGHKGDEVKKACGEQVHYVRQAQQLGTGHAVQQAEPLLPASGTVFVLCGDTPLLTAETLQHLLAAHQEAQAAATILTAKVPEPFGYGRIVRDGGRVVKIVEEKDATAEERKISEINTGTYIFDAQLLREALGKLHTNNAQGEYYLTDCIEELIRKDKVVTTYLLPDYRLALGVNDRLQLAEAQAIMQKHINEKLMAAGVTMIDPQTAYIDADVKIGRDTVIMPNTVLRGATQIGEQCIIGPNSEVIDCQVGNEVVFRHSVAVKASLADKVTVGPFAHLRPETVLHSGVKVGDFVEIKKSDVGENTKIAHLAYVGDAQIGRKANLGAGTIIVNYDGRKKHLTIIGDEAFVGCSSNLVAPVTIGDGAFVAAGSTITKDVPAGALSLARAYQVNKEGRAARLLKKKTDE